MDLRVYIHKTVSHVVVRCALIDVKSGKDRRTGLGR